MTNLQLGEKSLRATQFESHSMTGPLKRVLVCSPKSAGWGAHSGSSRWQELGFLRPPNALAADAQHEVLCHQLARSGADVVHFPAFGELTLDAVYAHDASLATDYGLIAMNLGKSSRSAESALHRSFCQSLGLPVLGAISHPGTTEAGDMIWLDSKTLLIGSGYRTNRPGIEQMRNLLLPHSVTVLAASLPHGSGPDGCLHLMSLISLLDEATAVVDLPWLSVETVELLRTRGYHLIEIDYRERESLASNVLALGAKRVLALEENVRTNEILRRAGFDVWTFPGSELCINGGGGPTCLTRPWSRA